jgi:hypothetical protein
LLLWSVAVYVLWLRAHLDLKQQVDHEVPDRYMAVLDLAAAIDQDLSGIGEKLADQTSRELRRRITKQLDGGRIEVATPTPTRYRVRQHLWAWIKKEAWWLLLAAFAVSIAPEFPPLFTFTAGVLLAIAVGKTRGSRIVIVLASLVMAAPFVAVFAMFVF